MKKFLLILIVLMSLSKFGYAQCAAGEVQVAVRVDGSAGSFNSEVSWALFDATTNGIIAERPLGFLSAGQVDTVLVCVTENADYRLEIYDSFGDGWNGATFDLFYVADGFVFQNGTIVNGFQASFNFTAGLRYGDDCSAPLALQVGNSYQIDTSPYTNFYVTDPLFNSGKEIIYEFVPPLTDTYNFILSLIQQPVGTTIQLFDACLDATPNIIDFDSSGLTTNNIALSAVLNEGSPYYVVISNNAISSGVDNTQGRLDVSFAGPPSNMFCAQSVNLSLDASPIGARLPQGQMIESIVVNDGFGNTYTSGDDVLYYDFNLTSPQDVVVSLDGLGQNETIFIQMAKQLNCGELAEDTYKRVSLFGANKSFAFDGLTAGNYIFKVFSSQFGSTTDPFTISISSFANMPAATNQDCSTAIAVQSEQLCGECSSPELPVQFFSTFNGSNSGLAAPCAQDSIYSAAASDIWVKTQAPSSGTLIVETYGEINDAFSTPESVIETRFSAYTGTCGALNEVFCSDDYSSHQTDTIFGLQEGEMVYIRLFDRNGDDEGDVGIRFIAEEALPTPNISVASSTPTSIDLSISDFSQSGASFQKGILVSADSFQTFVINYDPIFIGGVDSNISITGLEPATKYYIKAWNENGIVNNSDTTYFEARTSAFEINSIATGNWSDPNIWSSGTVPPADSAVLISHKVTINQGESFSTFKATIRNDDGTAARAGIWMNGGDLVVATDLDVLDNGSALLYDSLGIFITTTGTDIANLSVGENFRFDKGNPSVDFPLQLITINNGAGANVNVGMRFEFINNISDSTILYSDNIYFENARLDVGQQIVLNSEYIPSSQPLLATFLNSNLYTENLDLNGSTYFEGAFSVEFTGTTALHLTNSLYRSGNGGKIKFSDQSVLFMEGDNGMQLAGYAPGQDSVMFNDVVINLTSNQPDDYIEIRSSGTAIEADMIVNGNLSLINGKIDAPILNIQGGSDRVMITENGTTSNANDRSYVIGKLAKRGSSDFNFPVGHEQQFTPIVVSNFGTLLPSDIIEISAINNYCGDSILTTPIGIARLKTEEFWEINAVLSEPNKLVDLQPYFPTLQKSGITSLPALSLANLTSNTDLGNVVQTDSSFAATYDFNNGTSLQLGLGTADANENPFYFKRDVESISTNVAAPGDLVTITYTGSFASANDVVYFGDVPAITVGATANSIDVTIPAGARSGEVVIDTEFAGVLYINLAMTISNPASVNAGIANYNVLSDYNNISNAVDLTNAVMKFGQIDGDGSLDAMFVIPETDSVKVVSGIGLSSQLSGFKIASDNIFVKPTDVDLKLSNILKQGTGYDAAFLVEYQSAAGFAYYLNDGAGNLSLAGEVNAELGSTFSSAGIRDVEFDGVSDLFYSESSQQTQTQTVVFVGGSEYACSAVIDANPFLEFNDLAITHIIYGNFDGSINPNFMYLIDDQSRFGIGSFYATGPTNAVYSEAARPSGQIADAMQASLTGNSFHQVVASNQSTNEIEVYSYNGTSISKQSFALSFSPGALAIDDLNGDGYQDVVVSSQDEAALQIMFASNDGSGGLVAGDLIQYPGALIVDFEIADIDLDGNKDFVLLRGDGRLSIAFFENVVELIAPTVTASNATSLQFDLSWPVVEGADEYQVYVGLNNDTTTLSPNDSLFLVTNDSITFQVPEYSELYYYFVRSISSLGDTSSFSLEGNIKLPVSSYLEQDSLAMVSLYENANGVNWNSSQNWLTGKLNTWEGLGMINDSLKSVILPSNQIGSVIPTEVGNLNFVNEIDFAANNIQDISSLVPLVSSIVNLNVSGNNLNFEQLEAFNTVATFNYGNQDFNYFLPEEYFDFLGADISIFVSASSLSNTFQWFKDSVQIAGETDSVLVFNSLQRADEGLYYVEINNDLLGNLTLPSTVTELKVSSLERDVAALRQFYDSTNGDGWSSITWDTTSDNPTEWSSNNQDVIVEGNRVVEVNLPDNNLTGSIPSVLNEVLGIRTLNVSNNAIENIPALTTLPNLTTLDISGNALGYDDLENNISIDTIIFNDQANFGDLTDQRIPQGSAFSIEYAVAGSSNTYQWFRNGNPINISSNSLISVDSVTFETMGEYTLEVSNTLINAVDSDFRLGSNPVEITAIANISGMVTDANDFPTESGEVYLFKITEGQAFDSVLFDSNQFFKNVQTGGVFDLQNVELGDYILYVNNNENEYPNLINSYFPNTIDWELAEVIAFRSQLEDLKVIMEGEPQELTGTSVLRGYLEEEFEEERRLPRRRLRGAGVSVRRLAGSSRDLTLKSILQNNALVAYLETDGNGEFEIPNLPAGRYSVKFDIPGVPMNTESDVIFDLTGENKEALEISAVSDNGRITVNRLSYTANKPELLRNLTVYPNPSNGKFKITASESISNIKIISTEGRLIQEVSDFNYFSQEVEIDLSNYPDGLYFLQTVWRDGLRSMNKLIKE